MKYPTTVPTLRLAVAAAAFAAVGAFAQQATPPVMSDAEPLPANDRGSVGAIVLDKAPVRAQRDRDFEQAAEKSPDRRSGLLRATLRDRTKTDLDQDRQDAEVNLQRRGVGSITPK
ncbi:hypothetical protein [Caenimonas aquaedulcis]|uniref:DUF4148 domain-containing protein n=1 Tax=Caenimonas aquaedulcis TaxID=2793270 RepID=A0A931H5X7_9BURK|nr:hypothetical protein [Caenimonas aquaedulcis]MBG9389033.1 hypothetical protein [Caenimonas aquaedulcis]